MSQNFYLVKRSAASPALDSAWDSADWKDVPVADIASFRPESSDHHPVTQVKLQYTEDGFYGLFQVQDRYVRCVADHFQDAVCLDSCVEFFVEPPGGDGYLNFEFSGNGQNLVFHVIDHQRAPGGFAKQEVLTEEDGKMIVKFHTLPDRVEPEITESITWRFGFFIPFALLSKYCPQAKPASQAVWRGNFFKCGDETSHPHWASWQPVPELNFHEPAAFADLILE